MEIFLIIIGAVVWYIAHSNAKGKKYVKYLGYRWDIQFVDERWRKKEKTTIQSLDARSYLMHHCKLFAAMSGTMAEMAGEYSETVDGHAVIEEIDELVREHPKLRMIPSTFLQSWERLYAYVKNGESYAPLENNQSPVVIYIYAVILSMIGQGTGWGIQSIEYVGWSKVSAEQVAMQ